MINNDSKPKLIASDYDGTLAANYKNLNERTRKALWLAHSAGCQLALVTGRSEGVLPTGIEELPFDFLITGNGARIKDTNNGHYLSITSMKKDTALKILSALRGRAITRMNLYLDGKPYTNYRSLLGYHNHKHRNMRLDISRLLYRLQHVHYCMDITRLVKKTKDPIEKINVYFKSQADCKAAYKVIEPLDVAVYTTHGEDLEITAKGVTKGWALDTLCKYLSISPKEVVAFGDSGNDMSMINVAGSFFAPGNAIPELQANATKVIPSVEDDGVAVVLEEFFNHVEVELQSFSTAGTPTN